MKFKQVKPYLLNPARAGAALACIFSLCLFLAACHSGNNNNNNEEQAEEETQPEETTASTFYKYFQGTIGERKAVLQLMKHQDRYDGVLIDSLGQPLAVSGDVDSSSQLTLISYNHYNPVDTFTGAFPQPGVFQGFWSDTSGRHAAFVFQEKYPNGTYRWKLFSVKDSLAFDTTKKSPKARFQMSLLWPGKKSMTPAQWSLITDTIVKKYLNKDTSIADAAVVLKSAADSFFSNYKQLQTEVKPNSAPGIGATFNWESDGGMSLLWNADSLVSIAFKNYQYTGGAHGLGNTFLTVFDLKADKTLTLNDVFKPGYKPKLQKVLENELRKAYDIPANSSLNGKDGILFDKHLALTKNFYLTGSGIGFIYNPYEVAPYVVGQIELYVPFADIKDILKYPR